MTAPSYDPETCFFKDMTFFTLRMASNDISLEETGLRPRTQNYWQKWPSLYLKTQVARNGVSEGPNEVQMPEKSHLTIGFDTEPLFLKRNNVFVHFKVV